MSSGQSKTLLTLLAAALAMTGCRREPPPPPADAITPLTATELSRIKPEVERFCGHCHVTPAPESFPKDRWVHEIERGYQFYLLSGKTDVPLPARRDVLHYYQALAPERLILPRAVPMESSPRFVREKELRDMESPDVPATAHLLLSGRTGQTHADLITCDMRLGNVAWYEWKQGHPQQRRQIKLAHPDHITPADLDHDGKTDYLIADLGSFLPEDHRRGRVIWLRPKTDADFAQIVLLDQVGRVADVQPADVDADGDDDLIVAVFGWQTTGELLLLERDGMEQGIPQFTTKQLDPRTGAIHVCLARLNEDELVDFVVLFSQEHECIVGFVNQGGGNFQKQTIFQAPDPSYGSSGIQVVDLDRDGDLDVLYTNGDTFDSFYAKPYHGIRWIENLGADRWDAHLLLQMPGVHRAKAVDLDDDGDLDIAACSLIPEAVLSRQPEAGSQASLVWLENQALKFIPHVLESSNAVHATLELGDVNEDGFMDILVGNFQSPPCEHVQRAVTVWLGQEAHQASAASR
jgi:hypothetical protein